MVRGLGTFTGRRARTHPATQHCRVTALGLACITVRDVIGPTNRASSAVKARAVGGWGRGGCLLAGTWTIARHVSFQALCPARVPVGQVVCPTHGVQLHPTGTEGVAMTGTHVVTLHPHSVAVGHTRAGVGQPVPPAHWVVVISPTLYGTEIGGGRVPHPRRPRGRALP